MTRAKPHQLLATASLALGAVSLVLAFAPIHAARAQAMASLGPKPGTVVLHSGINVVFLVVTPNSAGGPNTITATLTRSRRPIANAKVTLTFNMPVMAMSTGRFRMIEGQRGVYSFDGPGMVMSGMWQLQLEVVPRSGRPFTVAVSDQVAPPHG